MTRFCLPYIRWAAYAKRNFPPTLYRAFHKHWRAVSRRFSPECKERLIQLHFSNFFFQSSKICHKFDKNNHNIFTSLVSEFTGKRKETDGQKPSEVPPTEYIFVSCGATGNYSTGNNRSGGLDGGINYGLQLFYAIVKLVSQNTQIRVIRALRTVRGQTFTVVPALQVLELIRSVLQVMGNGFIVGIDLYSYIVDSGLPLPFASKPRPQVSWYLESQIIHASTEVRETQGPGGETNVVTISNVTVKALTRRHHHAKLSCRANNTQLASPPTTTVVIELNNITKIFSDLKVSKIKNIVKRDLTRMVAHRHSRDSSDKKLTHQTNKFKLNRRKLPASSRRIRESEEEGLP
ncbi:hypothetical protein G5I_04642 [Acromyrmex echinatior]|uniref:Ig-like domain-containing protein n=1 Tax=Acromyrmex echinatior TaxID=103372 RepID=F4WG69_ACREC|nr:hypothetical protein G5I_04642 [Acromyrmex echinatior]